MGCPRYFRAKSQRPTEIGLGWQQGRHPRRSVATEVATIRDSPEVSALVEELDALRWVGRRGYEARRML